MVQCQKMNFVCGKTYNLNKTKKFRLKNKITMNNAVLRCVDGIKFLGETINLILN